MMIKTSDTPGSSVEDPVMETPKPSPILNIAWTRYAQLGNVSKRRSRAFKRLRIWIALLGILATFFAILTQVFFPNTLSIAGFVIKVFFVSVPIIASLLAAFGTRAFSNGDWLMARAAAEECLKEIYLYRTILQKKKSRRSYLEKRINEIQRQLYRGLGGELAFKPYKGPIPPHYNPNYPESDPGFHDLNGDEYFRYRLEDQLRWHQKEVNEYKQERAFLTFLVLAAGGLGAFFAAWGGPLGIWVALTASITAALIGWQELRNIDSVIKNYSKVILELTSLHDHWLNFEPEERTTAQFYRMVRGTEEVLWAQHMEYIRSQQEALQEADLEEEANLVNRAIHESVESETRMKQDLHDSIMEFARETLEETEEGVRETFKGALGSLAEEASSEIVQQELEQMGKAVAETAATMKERASPITSSPQQIAQEFAHVEIGRDTSKEELNAILARFPKTQDVKG
jgi:hypothetical protein